MLLLTSTTDKMQVITSAAGTVDVHASYADASGSPVSVALGRANTHITTAATTDIVAAPAASTSRNVKNLKISNNHATITNTVTLQHTDGTTVIQIEQCTLAPGERMGYEEGVGVRVFDAVGREKVGGTSLGLNANVNTADLAPAAATDTYLSGSNLTIGNRLQTNSLFHWKIIASKTAAGVAAAVFTIRFGTAGAIGDTARNVLTLAAQTAVVDTGQFDIIGSFTAVGASASFRSVLSLVHGVSAAGFAAGGTGGVYNLATVTSAVFDATPAATVVGLSLNTGASAAWTIQTCEVEAHNLLS